MNKEVFPERERKFRDAISRRQPTLTIVLENIHDPHNISAILRSCDAVGMMDVYVIQTTVPKRRKLGQKSSASARLWVAVHYFDSVEECVKELKARDFKIWATHLSSDAKGLYSLNLAEPAALVFGNEHLGVSDEICQYADGNFIIPMAGMIPSLNVSVACAVSLYEAYRQREQAGMYDKPQLGPEAMEKLYAEWTWK